MNFSYKASLNFPLYPQLFSCHHKPSRFNAGRQSSGLLMQRLMALHKEVQTHELSTGLSLSQSLLPRAVWGRYTHPSIPQRCPRGEGQLFLVDASLRIWGGSSSCSFFCSVLSNPRADGAQGLYLGAALSNLRNASWCALPLNCLCHFLNKSSASWISGSSATWLTGSPSSNSSKHCSAWMQKQVLAAPTAVASQDLPGPQVTPSSSISLLKLHH